jgi:hypothetical protein
MVLNFQLYFSAFGIWGIESEFDISLYISPILSLKTTILAAGKCMLSHYNVIRFVKLIPINKSIMCYDSN